MEDDAPFRASLFSNGLLRCHVESIAAGEGHIASFPPRTRPGFGTLTVERYSSTESHFESVIRFLADPAQSIPEAGSLPQPNDVVLLTNGIGGMARICVDLGRVKSKYDCVLAANLHPTLPVDRHVFAKRIRIWVTADGFISPLDYQQLV
jgi:hypothetical protein